MYRQRSDSSSSVNGTKKTLSPPSVQNMYKSKDSEGKVQRFYGDLC